MSDIQLFRIDNNKANQLRGDTAKLEKPLQNFFEENLEALLGVRFLKSEHPIDKGRIDTLGIDENNCPVVIEYKRSAHECVIIQGLFYLDWLRGNEAVFWRMVLDKFGEKAAEDIEWSSCRLICIAGDFGKYDEHAVKQIDRNIALIRYREYEGELFLLEQLTETTKSQAKEDAENVKVAEKVPPPEISQKLAEASSDLKNLCEQLVDRVSALGDDVQVKTLKYYIAFKKIKNFACVGDIQKSERLLLSVHLDPKNETLVTGFTEDISNVGKLGTGDLRVIVKNQDDLDKAMVLLEKAYQQS